MARRHISADEQREISSTFHHLILSGLLEYGDWTSKNIAFQGGTSLHLVWKSPRWSEDLDFIMDPDKRGELKKVLGKVQKFCQDWCTTRWPGCSVRLKENMKPENKLAVFDFVWSDPQVLESVRTKVEFFSVSPELVEGYSPKLRTLTNGAHGIITTAVPAADRIWVYHDKLHAIADRKFVKWRDLYDIWWLRTQSFDNTNGQGLVEPWTDAEFLKKSKVVNAMYNSTPANMVPGIDKFLSLNVDDLLASSERDLKPWLPSAMWRMMWPNQIKDIIQFVRNDLEQVRSVLVGQSVLNEVPGYGD